MCGLAGNICFAEARSSKDILQKIWLAQHFRGKDASGIAYLKDGKIYSNKQDVPVETFIKQNLPEEEWNDIVASPVVLMHARHATQGPQTDNRNNHPVIAYNWVVTHNGHVNNDSALTEYYGLETNRAAAVDTVAINMALSRGKTVEESISHLSMLAGTATFFAINLSRPNEVLLGRINGPALYLHLDRAARILYWSSDTDGLKDTGRRGLGTLNFLNVAVMPNNTVFHFTPDEIRQYKIDVTPFRMPYVPKASNYSYLPKHYQKKEDGKESTAPLALAPRSATTHDTKVTGTKSPGTSTSILETLKSWMGKAQNAVLNDIEPLIFTKEMAVSYSNPPTKEGKAIKPPPAFEEGMVGFAEDPPKLVTEYKTPYGTWFLTSNSRWFKPAKRVRTFWSSLNASLGISVLLPAGSDVQDALRGYYGVEVIKIYENKKDDHFTYGVMCPWCGIIQRTKTWVHNGYTCSWCKIKSRLRIIEE